jgi:acyl-CoA reductase-like NAD-dependent aldehyde dehydrogenase
MRRLSEALLAREEELRAVMHEHGKTWDQTNGDFRMLIEALDYYAGSAINEFAPRNLPDRADTHTHELRYEPV